MRFIRIKFTFFVKTSVKKIDIFFFSIRTTPSLNTKIIVNDRFTQYLKCNNNLRVYTSYRNNQIAGTRTGQYLI